MAFDRKVMNKIKALALELASIPEPTAKNEHDDCNPTMEEIVAFEKLRKTLLNSKELSVGKPMVGQLWSFKNYARFRGNNGYTTLIGKSSIILDEKKEYVEVLLDGRRTWMKKFYLNKLLSPA